ncbi:hypothetical protein JQX13_36320 [Archangium violaceum]|uniref:hypothetical protein n=1 Tax=Archangium violaceum TaxID=83451 RepID=UPI00193C6243|nr:hypothetical protein [Archangium violaceum]QRK05583.1 hypothetical protein JQX13_36320 [Archangium violaceum]
MASIADLIEQHREFLLQRYLEEASRLPSARDVQPQDVLDNLPEYLDSLIALFREQHREPDPIRRRMEETHLGLRLRLGYTREDVTAEFVLLGQLLSQLLESLPPDQQPPPEDTQRLFAELQAAREHTVYLFGIKSRPRPLPSPASRYCTSMRSACASPSRPPTWGRGTWIP